MSLPYSHLGAFLSTQAVSDFPIDQKFDESPTSGGSLVARFVESVLASHSMSYSSFRHLFHETNELSCVLEPRKWSLMKSFVQANAAHFRC